MTDGDRTHLVGTVVVDRYEVVGILGRGGNGVVCEVVDRSTKLRAALKMLVGEDPMLAARLEREGKALGLLAHRNIVALVDTGTLPSGSPYVVTELIRGRSLRDLLDWEPIDPRRALEIVRQVLDALDHVHAAGVIHRDVKPDNIMLLDSDRDLVKLLDFGVAKSLDPSALGEAKLTRAGLEVFGSPAYIAPEGAIGEPVDGRADLYALGIVLFEMLVGQLPFHHRDSTTLLRMHVTHPVPPLVARGRMFAREVEHVVKVALAKDPGGRFASALEMRTAVDAAARSLSARTPSGSGVQRWTGRAQALVTLARHHPQRVAIATAALALLVIVWIAFGR